MHEVRKGKMRGTDKQVWGKNGRMGGNGLLLGEENRTTKGRQLERKGNKRGRRVEKKGKREGIVREEVEQEQKVKTGRKERKMGRKWKGGKGNRRRIRGDNEKWNKNYGK